MQQEPFWKQQSPNIIQDLPKYIEADKSLGKRAEGTKDSYLQKRHQNYRFRSIKEVTLERLQNLQQNESSAEIRSKVQEEKRELECKAKHNLFVQSQMMNRNSDLFSEILIGKGRLSPLSKIMRGEKAEKIGDKIVGFGSDNIHTQYQTFRLKKFKDKTELLEQKGRSHLLEKLQSNSIWNKRRVCQGGVFAAHTIDPTQIFVSQTDQKRLNENAIKFINDTYVFKKIHSKSSFILGPKLYQETENLYHDGESYEIKNSFHPGINKARNENKYHQYSNQRDSKNGLRRILRFRSKTFNFSSLGDIIRSKKQLREKGDTSTHQIFQLRGTNNLKNTFQSKIKRIKICKTEQDREKCFQRGQGQNYIEYEAVLGCFQNQKHQKRRSQSIDTELLEKKQISGSILSDTSIVNVLRKFNPLKNSMQGHEPKKSSSASKNSLQDSKEKEKFPSKGRNERQPSEVTIFQNKNKDLEEELKPHLERLKLTKVNRAIINQVKNLYDRREELGKISTLLTTFKCSKAPQKSKHRSENKKNAVSIHPIFLTQQQK